jgi:hypothetical protein
MVLELQAHYIGGTSTAYHLETIEMNIYEAIGMAWVIFTSALASVGVIYLAFIGLKVLLKREQEASRDSDVPVEIKEMFKIAR